MFQETANRRLILASASPRRKELLSLLGLTFEIIPADVDEFIPDDEDACAGVQRLSTLKALAVAEMYPDAFVLAADTIVVLPATEFSAEELILGKPKDEAQAVEMLNLLQGQEHLVFTGFTLLCENTGQQYSSIVETRVCFKEITDAEIKAYVNSREPLDKAGAYAIQGLGGCFVKEIFGSFSNVIGLPMAEVHDCLKEFGLWSPTNFSTR